MMHIVLFDDYARADELQLDVAQIDVHQLTDPGPLLDVSHELLLRVFDPAVVDPKDTYISLLSPGGWRSDGFPSICLAASIDDGANRVVVGFVSASLMWIDEPSRQVQLAIGNIATSARLKAKGVRGIGSALWDAAVEFGAAEVERREGALLYSVAEAEPESIGFWKKLGYLWPEGIRYLQPPLEFDDDGRPLHEEVPETFVVRPMFDMDRRVIDSRTVRRMIMAVYRNWCIEPNRAKLSSNALQAAEQYVFGRVFALVEATVPVNGMIRLKEISRLTDSG